jgi:hypothetical protein
MKWMNHYTTVLPKGYSLFFTHPSNRFDLPFITMSGFVDTDVHNIAVHLPFLIKKGWSGLIESGTPIAQIIPIKREYWKSDTTFVDEIEKIARYEKHNMKAHYAYKKNIWSRKSYK